MLKMVDGTGIIGVDMICPLGVSTPQPPNYDRVELEGTGMLVLQNSLDAPLERLELGGKTEQVQTTGAQLWKPIEDKTVSGVENTTDKDGVIHLSGTCSGSANVMCGSIKTAATCTLSCVSTGTFPSNANVKVSVGVLSILNSNDARSVTGLAVGDLRIRLEGGFTYNDCTLQIMLHEGSTALPYEPYTGGKPSPSQEYQQEIKNVGKWNEETQKYEVDVKVTNSEQGWTEEQTLTLTSDRPITKWDKLVEQGGQIGWLYENKKYTVTGRENFMFGGESYYSGVSTDMYTNAIADVNIENILNIEALCHRLKKVNNIWSFDCNTIDGFCINGAKQTHIRFYNSLLGVNDDATMQEKRAAYIAYLKKEYEKGTPYEIVYQSLEPEFVPLPQSEQNAIRALKTYYPTTVITADGGELDPDIKVTYRKEI